MGPQEKRTHRRCHYLVLAQLRKTNHSIDCAAPFWREENGKKSYLENALELDKKNDIDGFIKFLRTQKALPQYLGAS